MGCFVELQAYWRYRLLLHVFSSYKKQLVDLSGWKKRRLVDILVAKKHVSYFFQIFQ